MALLKYALSLLILLGLMAPVSAETTSEALSAIQAAYDKRAEAAQLKFVDGLLSGRADDFQAIAPDGTKADLGGERSRFQALFSPAWSVKLVTKIVSSRQVTAESISCEVDQVLEFETVNARKKPFKTSLYNQSTSLWVKTATGWKEKLSRLKTHSLKGRPGHSS